MNDPNKSPNQRTDKMRITGNGVLSDRPYPICYESKEQFEAKIKEFTKSATKCCNHDCLQGRDCPHKI